eukprot:11091637-Alexandrium_andersonii.AAC.1
MELLAAERAKEAELLSLLAEHQAQVGACASLAVDARGGTTRPPFRTSRSTLVQGEVRRVP